MHLNKLRESAASTEAFRSASDQLRVEIDFMNRIIKLQIRDGENSLNYFEASTRVIVNVSDDNINIQKIRDYKCDAD